MRKWACFLALAACVGDDQAQGGVIGSWVVDDGEYACVWAYDFDARGRYERALVCELESGAYGMQIERGDYEDDGDSITLWPNASSCPSGLRHSYEYTRDGDRLTVDMGDWVGVYEPLAGGDGTGSALIGCFDDTGQFNVSAVQPL